MPRVPSSALSAQRDPAGAVAANPFWYHTLEVAPGVSTPGWFDLRPIVDELPWPDVRGKRCLDVGTADGFFAFELERRGASEVTAVDLADHRLWDWPPHLRERGVEFLRTLAGAEKLRGIHVACDLLGSSVRVLESSAYDLDPDELGMFDVVVCGSLLLHLRDPVRALEAMRSVCRGHLLVTNEVALSLLPLRRAPLVRLDGVSDLCQWWVPSPGGHRRMVAAAGFEIVGQSRVYSIPFGTGHPQPGREIRTLARRLAQRVVGGRWGVPHQALLARPAL